MADGSEASWQQLLRLLVDRVGAGLAIADAGGTLRWVNQATAQLLGRSAEDLVGRDLRDLTHPDDVGRTDDARSSVGAVSYEKRYLRPDGSVAWALVGGEVVRLEGRPTYFVGSLTDISSRKAAEEELARRVAQQEAVVDLSRRALFGTEVDELLDLGLEAVRTHLGVSRTSVLELLPGGDSLLLRRTSGWIDDSEELVLPRRRSHAGHVIDTDAPVVTTDVRTEDRYLPAPELIQEGVRSSAGVVLRVDGRPWVRQSPNCRALDRLYAARLRATDRDTPRSRCGRPRSCCSRCQVMAGAGGSRAGARLRLGQRPGRLHDRAQVAGSTRRARRRVTLDLYPPGRVSPDSKR